MVSIAEGMIFTAGDFGDEEMVIALDMDGRLLWKSRNGESWNGPQPGSRTTPTYDDGVLYHMNPTGRLAALEATTGRTVWSVDLRLKFGARHGTWAMAENLAVDGDRVFCVPGGSKALVAALDKRTGKLLRSHPHLTPHDQNVNRPIFHDGYVFVASGHKGGATLLKINPDLRSVTEIWSREDLDNCHGGVILREGCVYGAACRSGGKAFFSADFLTGEVRQADKTLGKVSLTCAERMLYGISDRGQMLLIKIAPGRFSVVSQFRVPKESLDLFLAHPVVCGGRLYVRHANNLFAYDVSAR